VTEAGLAAIEVALIPVLADADSKREIPESAEI
jgi:hypothetical protein